MSVQLIFLVGLLVSGLCLGSLAFSIAELRRLGRESDARRERDAG
jgi:hypothetical protein